MIGALCACLPVFYVLSVGPAILIFKKFNLDDGPIGDAIHAFYSPLRNYANKNPDRPEVKLLQRYANFWGD